MELRPFVPGRHHPRFHVIPEAIERDVDRADLLAGTAARAFPRVPRELLAGLHMAAEQQIQRPAHLVLPEREDPTAGRGAFPARFLVCGADGDAVAAHRARVDIFLNGRHLCKASHPIPPTRSGAQVRELAVGLDGLPLVLLREILEKGPSGSGGLGGGRAKEDRRVAAGFRRDFPGLRQGDLLLERIAGSAAAGTHARHRLRLSDESAHLALDLGDRVERIEAGHDRGMRRRRARDRLELRELGLLPAAHFLERDFDPHLRHRGVRQIVEGQALYDGPDRAREDVRLPPNLRGQGTRPPYNPMDFWMRPRGYQDLPLVAGAPHRKVQKPHPNCFFAVSDIISGVPGGSPTMVTTAPLTPLSCSGFRLTSLWMYAEAGHPGAVRVILTSILPSSGLRSMLYTKPRS